MKEHGCFTALLVVVAVLAASWGFSCFLVWLISLCFNIAFSLKIATGIWLILWLLGGLFKQTSKTK